MADIRRKPVGVDYGRRLISTLIDQRAESNHQRPYASIPVSNNVRNGYQDVSYKLFANAINRCALWIKEQLGLSTEFETLVYIGANDLRYQIITAAAVKTGHVIFLVAPSNSIDAFESLFKEAAATTLVVSDDAPPIVDKIFAAISIRRLIVPSLQDLLAEAPVAAVPFTKTFDEYRMKPWIMLHTSGSTGTPKHIVIRHGYPTTVDAVMWSMSWTLFTDATVVLGSTAPLSVNYVEEGPTFGRVDVAAIPPSLLTECGKSDSFIKKIQDLQAIDTGGGPLSETTGDLLSKYVQMYAEYGSTEMGVLPLLPPDQKEWQYINFNEQQGGLEFRPAENDLYELVIVRSPGLELMQAIFVTFPDQTEYATKDLYSKHPTKAGLWKYASRRDDIIVYASGEKMNPVTMEGTISACPDVAGCLVVGAGRPESGLLIEARNPPTTDHERHDLLEKIWPYVERSNESTVAHGRIAKDRIIFTTADRPLSRAGKGTIQRGKSVAIYEKEIDELYNTSSKPRTSSRPRMDLHTHSAMVKSLQDYVVTTTGHDSVAPDTDFFRLGLDSVQVMEMTRTINASLDTTTIEPKQIYDNPTVERLAATILSAGPGPVYDSDSDDDIHLETWTQMQQMFHDFTADYPRSPPKTRKMQKYRRVRAPSVGEMRGSARHRVLGDIHKTITSSSRSENSEKHTESPDPVPQYLAAADETFLISMLPPDGGTTAWLHVAASFLINLNMWGLVESFGVYQIYYQQVLLKDKSTTALAWIVSVQAALLLIVGVFSGALFDKGYFRSIVLIAGFGMVFALMMLSLARSYYQVMLCQGLLLGFCSGLLYIPSLTVIPLYFKDRRGLAFGIAISGASIGGIIYPVALQRMLDEVGFGWATRIIAFIVLVTLGVVILITKPLPMTEKPSREFIDWSALKEIPFLTFMMTGFFSFCAFLVPYVLTPAFAIDELKSSHTTSSYLIGVINAAQIFGQIGPAWLSDHVGGEAMLGAALFLDGILGFCWISTHDMGRFVAFLIFWGFSSGMIITLPPIVMPYVCPSLAVLGTRLGMVYASAGVGALVGPPIAVYAARSAGGFLGEQVWVGTCLIVSAASFGVTGIAAYRQRQMNDSKRQRVTSPAFLRQTGTDQE